MNTDLSLLRGYPENLIDQVKSLIRENKLDFYLNSRYPQKHEIHNNKALFTYVQDIKRTYMKKASPIHKVTYDESIETVYKALGLHSFVSRVQGKNLKAKSEIRIAAIFKKAPTDFLQMIVVHELAHLKEKDHNKDFYRLCHHMEGDYSQLEFDLRLYLISLGLR
jgi:predicted metal-dependent hydrolase